ncbi:MAG: SDR family oxidoreductase [Desulfofustis sp. PB-SRB1]|jgi:NAD(P)-dependent dehydrogenase (short-subunit alcohol dehydrogenase family)|nr:SDR family oxidoreductase [Desulfofustis sp. PB-SRB1]MBM1002805.1 SDR family oxidoreductase [Desulfofustis sp. PB-SRB1]HBH29514.1 SDR family oxidoreductase [Desulfofustis sp.]HBH30942.1 SDR family oxidoreductase [Desulfofustis sp.]
MEYLEEMFSLTGRTAVVSGGAGAIGTVMSDALLRAGANVVVWSRTDKSLEHFLKRYRDNDDLSTRLSTAVVDAGDEDDVERALSAATEHFTMPEILVNGVGGNRGKRSFIDIEIKEFTEVVNLNLIAGLVVPTKVFCRHWIERSVPGSIINLTSMTSYTPLSGVWAYDAAKSAVLNLTMAAANEFAAHHIRVNAIAPGFFLGKQNKSLLIDKKSGDYTERGRAVINRTPFKRFGAVQELAGATVFLANNKASGFITGVSIPVDGGYLIHNI